MSPNTFADLFIARWREMGLPPISSLEADGQALVKDMIRELAYGSAILRVTDRGEAEEGATIDLLVDNELRGRLIVNYV